MDREPSREASPAAATEPGSAGGTSSLTSVSDVWDERNDQRWIDPRAGPAPTVSRVLYQLYWTIPVGLPPGHRALMRLDDALVIVRLRYLGRVRCGAPPPALLPPCSSSAGYGRARPPSRRLRTPAASSALFFALHIIRRTHTRRSLSQGCTYAT